MSNDAFDRVLWDEVCRGVDPHSWATIGAIRTSAPIPFGTTKGYDPHDPPEGYAFVRDDLPQCSTGACQTPANSETKPVCCGAACLGCNRCPPFHVKRADDQQIQRWQLERVHPPVNPPMDEDEPE